MVIGIIGMGYVGGACYEGFKEHIEVETYDIDENKNPTCQSIAELTDKCNIIFVCVPTPSRTDGTCDTTIVEKVVAEINQSVLTDLNKSPIVVLKSTISPTTTHKLQLLYPMLKICFNPEFLTEAKWKEDFLSQEYTIVGYDEDYKHLWELVELYRITLHIPVYFMTSTEAEMVKYISNIFLATKVSLMNEFYTVAEELNKSIPTKWDMIRSTLMMDERIGETHLQVPGPDGKRGFGGTCFPKDISAFQAFAENELHIAVSIIDAVRNRNITIDRPEQDWKELVGRAISKN